MSEVTVTSFPRHIDLGVTIFEKCAAYLKVHLKRKGK
jgi:hypothetical protein